jgi:hypothetical protein
MYQDFKRDRSLFSIVHISKLIVPRPEQQNVVLLNMPFYANP